MLQIACKNCNNLFDFDKQSVLCPHLEFPLNKKCKLHCRLHCGHKECLNNLLQFPQKIKKGITNG